MFDTWTWAHGCALRLTPLFVHLVCSKSWLKKSSTRWDGLNATMINIYIYIYTYMYTYIYIYICTYIWYNDYVDMYIHIHVHMHVYIGIYVYKHINNTYMCIDICDDECMCICVYSIYVHVHTWFYTLVFVASLQRLLDVLLANHDMKLLQHCRASMFWQLLPAGPGGTINERSIWILKYKTHQKPIGLEK